MGSYKCCDPADPEFKNIRSLSALLKLVAEESRLKILCIRDSGTHCVCEIMENIDLSQSLISHHLSDLNEAGLVSKEKKGRRVYYRLTNYGKNIMNRIQEMETRKEVSQ